MSVMVAEAAPSTFTESSSRVGVRPMMRSSFVPG